MHGPAADHRDQGGGAPRRMQGLSQMHHGNGGGNGNGCGQPGFSAQPLEGGHPDDGGENMAAEQVPGLGQGAANSAVDKHGRGAEGADDHHQVGMIEQLVVDERDRGNA